MNETNPQYPQTLSRNITKAADGVYVIKREYVPKRVPARPHAFTCAETGQEFVIWARGSRPWADRADEDIKLPELFLKAVSAQREVPPEIAGLL